MEAPLESKTENLYIQINSDKKVKKFYICDFATRVSTSNACTIDFTCHVCRAHFRAQKLSPAYHSLFLLQINVFLTLQSMVDMQD